MLCLGMANFSDAEIDHGYQVLAHALDYLNAQRDHIKRTQPMMLATMAAQTHAIHIINGLMYQLNAELNSRGY